MKKTKQTATTVGALLLARLPFPPVGTSPANAPDTGAAAAQPAATESSAASKLQPGQQASTSIELSNPAVEHPRRITAVIAIVPDPTLKNLALPFDRKLDALMQAANGNHYVESYFWLPWRALGEPGKAREATQTAQTAIARGYTFGTDVMAATGNAKLTIKSIGHVDVKTSAPTSTLGLVRLAG